MRALTVQPGLANSLQLEDVPPPPGAGSLLVRALALGFERRDDDVKAVLDFTG